MTMMCRATVLTCSVLLVRISTASAQEVRSFDVQVHLGKGDGYVSSITYGADVAWNVTDWIALQGSLARWRSHNVVCIQIWPDSYACSFKGNSLTFTGRIRFVKVGRAALLGAVGFGWFRHADNLIRDTKPAVPIRLELSIDLADAWQVVAGWRHLRIDDKESEALLDEPPRYSVVAVGVQWRFAF